MELFKRFTALAVFSIFFITNVLPKVDSDITDQQIVLEQEQNNKELTDKALSIETNADTIDVQEPEKPSRLWTIAKWTLAVCAVAAVIYAATHAFASPTHEKTGSTESSQCQAEPTKSWFYDWTVGWFAPSQKMSCGAPTGYCTCGLHCQSPINIDTASALKANLPDIKFNYQPTSATVSHLGHTIQVSEATSSTNNAIEVDGKTYQFKQFHFHSPSEHVIDNRRFDMEVHFVHKDDDGNIAVVGAVIDESAKDHASYDKLFATLPSQHAEVKKIEGSLDLHSLLPVDKRTYRYAGSLTTPPYSTGVKWMLMREPLTFSREQIDAIKELMEENARELQPQGDRVVAFDTTIGD